MTSDVIDQAIENLIDRDDIHADAALSLITRAINAQPAAGHRRGSPTDRHIQTHRQNTVPVGMRAGVGLMDVHRVPEDGQDPVTQALAGGSAARMGSFRFWFETDTWEWSAEVQRLHGYMPGTITPTTELVLSHKHPDDRNQVAATIDEIRRNHGAFSTRHRIIDTHGRTHQVVVVATRLLDQDGNAVATEGVYIDVTPSERERQDIISVELADIVGNRAMIEQAKGMIMVIYGVDENTAFDLLKWRSQESNIKLRALAEQVATEFAARSQREAHPLRSAYDNVLLTAHLRIASHPKGGAA
jgi:ANTAR domain/PAS fold